MNASLSSCDVVFPVRILSPLSPTTLLTSGFSNSYEALERSLSFSLWPCRLLPLETLACYIASVEHPLQVSLLSYNFDQGPNLAI